MNLNIFKNLIKKKNRQKLSLYDVTKKYPWLAKDMKKIEKKFINLRDKIEFLEFILKENDIDMSTYNQKYILSKIEEKTEEKESEDKEVPTILLKSFLGSLKNKKILIIPRMKSKKIKRLNRISRMYNLIYLAKELGSINITFDESKAKDCDYIFSMYRGDEEIPEDFLESTLLEFHWCPLNSAFFLERCSTKDSVINYEEEDFFIEPFFINLDDQESNESIISKKEESKFIKEYNNNH